MSELVVGSLKGLSSKGFVIDVASGSRIKQTGSILQVVSTAKTDTFGTTSTSFTAVTGLSASITPLFSTSKILVVVHIGTGGTSGSNPQFRLSGGNSGTYVGNADGSKTRASLGRRIIASEPSDASVFGESIVYLDSPNTTSSVTYQVEARTSAGTIYVNRGGSEADTNVFSRTASSITLMEVAG